MESGLFHLRTSAGQGLNIQQLKVIKYIFMKPSYLKMESQFFFLNGLEVGNLKHIMYNMHL